MKKYLISIILLCFAFTSWAGNLQKKVIARKNVAAAGHTDYTADANCMGAWFMNSSGNETDRSGEGNTLVETTGVIALIPDECAGVDDPQGDCTGSGTASDHLPSGYSGKVRDFEYGNSAYLLGAVDGSLDISGHTGLTIAMWVKVEGDPGAVYAISKWNNSNTYRQYTLRTTSANDYSFAVSNDGSATVEIVSDTAFNQGTYQHVVGVHDPDDDELRIYVNGSSDASPVAHSTGIYAGNAAFNIGAETVALYWDGLMDEVIVFNRVLSPAEITELYTYGIDGSNGGND